jgi:cobyrinic acid a,c-diamide synthase
MSAPAVIIAAHRSGAGKTTATLALLAGLRRKKLTVQAAKTGPDYIDPAFHAAATGRDSINLDSWAMGPQLLDGLMQQITTGCDIAVVEGVMGLFDGVGGVAGHTGSTADIAAQFSLPVILVIDAAGQSQSAAALLRGFASHDPNVRIAGVILNRAGSERHARLLTQAIDSLKIPVFGILPRDDAIALPSRHLGLVQAVEHGDLSAMLDALAQLAARHLDLDAILSCAKTPRVAAGAPTAALPPPGMRIALAHDDAFTFLYPHIVRGWREQGAEIVPFSPLDGEGPAETCDACWLPGGYPELHAGALAAAETFKTQLVAFAETRPVHGECGGYMVLGEALVDADGIRHTMTGLLGHVTSFAQRKLHLGYREARLLSDCVLGKERDVVRGHEFHYAMLTETGNDAPFAQIFDGEGNELGPEGGRRGQVTGTFFHVISAV